MGAPSGPGSRHTCPSPEDKKHCEEALDAVLSPESHQHIPAPEPSSLRPLSPTARDEPCMEARGSLGLPLLSLTLSQASRVFTSCAFWHDRMEPARLSMTPSTESSVKKAICSGRRGAAGCAGLRSREPARVAAHPEAPGSARPPHRGLPHLQKGVPPNTYHKGERPLPGDDANEPGQCQLQTHKPRGEHREKVVMQRGPKQQPLPTARAP